MPEREGGDRKHCKSTFWVLCLPGRVSKRGSLAPEGSHVRFQKDYRFETRPKHSSPFATSSKPTLLGEEPKVKSPDSGPHFIADRMLGRLARYLRLLGYDTSYPPPGHDALLLAKAQAEGRILLTRDHGIFTRKGPRTGSPQVVKIASHEVLHQLAQLAECGLIQGIFDPRCSICNLPLQEISELEARHLLPPFTLATHCSYSYCSSCNAVLWEGSHWVHFRERISRTLHPKPSESTR